MQEADASPGGPAGGVQPGNSQRAWTRRRADLEKITGIDDVLAEIDARAKELERRTAAVLAQGRGSGR